LRKKNGNLFGMSIVDGGSGYFDDTKFLSYSIGRRHL
jgi:hypothetical protein